MSSFDQDQLQPDDTLEDRGVDDVLDEGMSPPERPSPEVRHALTPAEQREGESLDERLDEEVPDPLQDVYAETQPLPEGAVDENTGDLPAGEVGDERAGRLVSPDEGLGEDTEQSEIGQDVGIDGSAAGAEEAAVHVIDGEDEQLDR